MTRVYGFRGCDLVRKATKWLDARGVAHTFVDYRKTPLAPPVVDDWFARAGWTTVFNRNATTFKLLPEEQRASLDERSARDMILAETNFIKRPVLDTGRALLFGFDAKAWEQALAGD